MLHKLLGEGSSRSGPEKRSSTSGREDSSRRRDMKAK